MDEATQRLIDAAVRWAETAVRTTREREQLEDELADAAIAYRAVHPKDGAA